MNFEEAYERFMQGTATEEEALFVRDEIRKAREVSSILDRVPAEDLFCEADHETIRKARKRFNTRAVVRTIVIVLLSLILLAGAICGYIFGTAIHAAKASEVISEEQALEAAREFLTDFLGNDVSHFAVHEIDRHLDMSDGLKRTQYRYEIELRDGRIEYEVSVNAVSGYCMLTDIDRH